MGSFGLSQCVNHGTTARRLRGDHKMTAGRLQDDRGTTTGRLQHDRGTTGKHSRALFVFVVPGCGSEAPLDGVGGRNTWPETDPSIGGTTSLAPTHSFARAHAGTHDTNTKPKPIVRLGVTKDSPPNLRWHVFPIVRRSCCSRPVVAPRSSCSCPVVVLRLSRG